jgi:cytochrome P450
MSTRAEHSGLDERFDPFNEPYLADPYEFFAEARAATPVFYSAKLKYWVVTRYHDIRQIFENPRQFSAGNALSALKPACPATERILVDGDFRPVPTLANVDPPAHTRVRRLVNVAFKPRRVAAMEPFIRDLVVKFSEQRLACGSADLIRDFAWELPALVIFRIFGVPDEDVPRIKAGAESRILFMFGHPSDEDNAGSREEWRRSGAARRSWSRRAPGNRARISPANCCSRAMATCPPCHDHSLWLAARWSRDDDQSPRQRVSAPARRALGLGRPSSRSFPDSERD